MPSIIRGSDSFDSKDVNVGTAKAFVNFNGTGTVAIRGTPHNVSSITDIGTGDYEVNLTTPMADTNYTTQVSGQYSTTTKAGLACQTTSSTISTTTVGVSTANSAGSSANDFPRVYVTIFSST